MDSPNPERWPAIGELDKAGLPPGGRGHTWEEPLIELLRPEDC